jgi:hypothetical protein
VAAAAVEIVAVAVAAVVAATAVVVAAAIVTKKTPVKHFQRRGHLLAPSLLPRLRVSRASNSVLPALSQLNLNPARLPRPAPLIQIRNLR